MSVHRRSMFRCTCTNRPPRKGDEILFENPACPRHGVAASNARESEYWERVGGHPPPEQVDR